MNLNLNALSGQELHAEMYQHGEEDPILKTRAHARPVKILRRFMQGGTPDVDIERGYYFTQSMRQTEGQPLILRWSKAMRNIVKHITIYVDKDQLIVGSIGGPNRYGILYPEVDGTFYDETFGKLEGGGNKAAPFKITYENSKIVRSEICDYWKGKTYIERYAKALPEETRRLTYRADDDLQTRFLVSETASYQSSLQWTLDYGKVLKYGMKDIRRQAEEGLAALDPLDPEDVTRRKPFYEAVIMTCDNLKLWAERHAQEAERQAAEEKDETRKQELLRIAENCRNVPENPARNFWEAVQSQWFIQLYSRLEAKTATIVSNGRMDQYLYPFYKADCNKGMLDEDGAMEILGCLWSNMARYLELHISAIGIEFSEGYAHWEAVCVGGQTPEGRDATNELTHLFFRSAREFPTHYPDLAARVHSMSPHEFLWDVAETIKDGGGFPKLINDEEVVPTLLTFGANRSEALDYTISGCTEVRMINRDTYLTVGSYVNYGSILESTLYNGRIPLINNEVFGLETGESTEFKSWDEFWTAFMKQHDYFFSQALIQHYVANQIFYKSHAVPLSSALHDLCMADCKDLHEPHIKGGINVGFIDCIGIATLVDSLSAIKKFVFEEKKLSMQQLIDALNCNFATPEAKKIQAMLVTAPAYGNNDSYADSIAFDLDTAGASIIRRYNDTMGVTMTYRMVPVTSHVPFGKVVGATPDGRLSKAPLSDGASPSHGRDLNGPTSVLLSNYMTKNPSINVRTSRLLNVKFSPSCVAGDEGTERLIDFIRSLVDMKLWHIQFNVVNRETLLAAQANPEQYKTLVVRIAGYSAYFCDLSKDLQNDLINRTSNENI